MKLKKSKTITLRLRNKNAQNSRTLLRGFKTQDGKLWEGDVLFKEFSQLQENLSVTIALADNKCCGFYIAEE